MAKEQQATVKKATFINRRFSTFISCLLLSSLFWLFLKLSNEYQITIRIPVAYSNLPGNGLVAVELPDSVDAQVSASGFTLFAYRWTNAETPLNLDVRQARSLGGGDYALATYAHPERLDGLIGQGLRILQVMPDTIVLSFSGAVEKRVPVRPKAQVSCAPAYRMGDSIRTIPAYVTLVGAEALVKRIEYVETEPKTFTNLDHSINETVKLVLPDDLKQVGMKPGEVNLIIPVGQYTEKRISIPVEAINVPANAVLKTFPDKVDVIFQVPFEDYGKINADMFRVIADFSKTDPQSSSIQVELVRQPLNIRNLRMEPQRVEYLIRK